MCVCVYIHVDIQIFALEKELEKQHTELDGRVIALQSVETVYRTEAQENGIATNQVDVNIKNAYDSPQTNGRLQDIHVAYKAVQSKQNEVAKLDRDIEAMHERDRELDSAMALVIEQHQQHAIQVRDLYSCSSVTRTRNL